MSHPVAIKLDRIASVLDRRSAESCWFLRPENFAWLTGGSAVVDAANDVGVAAVGYDGDAVRVVAPNNEAERIVDEELPALESAGIDVTVAEYEWHEGSLARGVAGQRSGDAVADVPIDGFSTIDASSLRTPIPPAELDRYRAACVETAAAVEAVAADLDAETSEREAAGRLVGVLVCRGFAVPVVLVGGADRGVRHRHFTPTDEPLGSFGHLTVVAERGGHNVAVTRTVAFDPPAWLAERHEAACRVAATAVAATRDAAANGGTAGDVFDAIRDAYAAVGYPDEWRRHHQGGAIGYVSREWTAVPGDDTEIASPMPYAWNPTMRGAKCEDTVSVDADGVDVLTTTGEWPETRYEPVGFEGSVAFHDPSPAGR